MNEDTVRVNLYWGGKVLYEAGSVIYNRRPVVVQMFPLSLKYERLQRLLRNKIGISDPEDVVVITGRYPTSFPSNGVITYGETCIWNDDPLSIFLRTIKIFGSHINLTSLDIYASIERCPIVQEPTDNEFDLCDTSYLPNLNVGSSRGIVQ